MCQNTLRWHPGLVGECSTVSPAVSHIIEIAQCLILTAKIATFECTQGNNNFQHWYIIKQLCSNVTIMCCVTYLNPGGFYFTKLMNVECFSFIYNYAHKRKICIGMKTNSH